MGERQTDAPHVVVVGGGFAGLHVALGLRARDAQVTLIDRRNFHLFQPLLYQVATGGLSPANIAAPLRKILCRRRNVRVLLGEVVDIDPTSRRCLLADGQIAYDALVVATGATHNYFGKPHWAALAPGLKTIEDATEIRARVLRAFETAERESQPDRVRALLTFVVVGAGATGVELAGALAEIARDTLRHDFRKINPSDARILLIDGADRVLPGYPPELSAKAKRALERLGVTVWTGTMISDLQPGAVVLRAAGGDERIASETVLWAAGIQASWLGRVLAERAGARVDGVGRVLVEPDLTIGGHPEIFVIGDLAALNGADGNPLPGIAPVAMQQGRYVARVLRARRLGNAIGPFAYRHKGSMATIGRAAAVADFGWLRFSGYLAWLAWLFVHLMFLVEFQNRLLVMVQWAWNYATQNRSARLITGETPLASGDSK